MTARRSWTLVILASCVAAFAGCEGRRSDRADRPGVATLESSSSVIAVRGVRLIDGTGAPPVDNVSIVVDGQRLRDIGPSDRISIPPGVPVLDGSGTAVLPGLVSDHSHVGMVDGITSGVENGTRANILRQLAQYEAYGVTTVTSLGFNGAAFYELQPELHRGAVRGADLFGADRGIGVPDGAPPVDAGPERLYRAETPEQAVSAVRDSASRHPDLLKIWVDDFHGSLRHEMSPEVQQAVIAEAHRLGLRVAAHVYYLEDAKRLVRDGVDILAHGIRDRIVDDEIVQLLRNHKTWYVPTLGLDEASYIYAEAPEWFRQQPSFQHAVQPALAAQLDDPAWRASVLGDAKKVAADKESLANNLTNLKRLHDAGVEIGFGTDSGATPLRIPGFAEHRELLLMVTAGLSPGEAIRIATSQAARLLGLRDRGVLAPGRLADFIITRGDPSANVGDLARIVEVWHRGRNVAGQLESFQP